MIVASDLQGGTTWCLDASNEKELREWQHVTGLMINENKDIISNPARVLNFVETSFELSAGKTKVLAQKRKM